MLFHLIPLLTATGAAKAGLIKRWPGRGEMTIDVNDRDALLAAGKGLAKTVMCRYPNDPPGLFETTHNSQTVNWWQTAIAWTSMINHYETTGDYYDRDQVIDSIKLNQGAHFDYEPAWAGIENGEGNDDEGWFAIMSIAGYDTFGNGTYGVDWLGNAENAHYMMSRYWANSSAEAGCLCGGGIRWQQDPSDPGWPYLNSITNGLYFLLSSLLYERTNDTSYLDWAQVTYDWMKNTSLTEGYQVYDGITAPNCTRDVGGGMRRFSYLPAGLIGGTAVLYNVTGDAYWKSENTQFIQGVKDYYTNGTSVLIEPTCTFDSDCLAKNTIGLDRTVFKGILVRELARSYSIIPNPTSKEMIQDSLTGMVKNCDSDWQCGYFWEGVDDLRNTTMQFQSLELVNAALVVV